MTAASGERAQAVLQRPSHALSLGLFVLAALVAAALCLISVAGIWGDRVAQSVAPRLAGDVSVLIWGHGLESAEAAAARAGELLANAKGVNGVTPLDPDPSDRWLGRLLGRDTPEGDGPRLLTIKRFAEPGSASDLVKSLRAQGLTAVADDHRGRGGVLKRFALYGGAGALAALLVLCLALYLAAAVAGRSTLEHGKVEATLMSRLGATPSLICALATRWSSTCVFAGAAVGSLAIAAWTIINIPAVPVAMAESLSQTPLDAVVTLPWPFLLFAVARQGGRAACHGALKRQGRGG